MAIIDKLKIVLKSLTRKNNPVDISMWQSVNPVSDVFGFDRGTPIDRYYIENFISQNCKWVKGDVLEIGESKYTQKYGNDIKTSTVLLPFGNAKDGFLIADLSVLGSVPENHYDCVICTQTLNFIENLENVPTNINHMLKPGGVALITVASISPISTYDNERWGDFWRFTDRILFKMFSPIMDVLSKHSFGNVLATSAFLYGLAKEDIKNSKYLDHVDNRFPMVIAMLVRKK